MGCKVTKGISEPEPTVKSPPTLNEVKGFLKISELKSFRNQKKAGMNLLQFAQTSRECCEQLVQEGVIEILTKLSESKSPEAQEYSLRVFMEISRFEYCREHILNLSAVLPLTMGLRSKRSDLRELSLDAIEKMCSIDRAKVVFVNEGVVPGYVFFQFGIVVLGD